MSTTATATPPPKEPSLSKNVASFSLSLSRSTHFALCLNHDTPLSVASEKIFAEDLREMGKQCDIFHIFHHTNKTSIESEKLCICASIQLVLVRADDTPTDCK